MRIIFKDNDLLAVDKPPGVPSQPDSSRDPALAELCRDMLAADGHTLPPGFPAPLHRLDRPTSGIVLLARNRPAAAALSEQFRLRTIEKDYLAMVECAAEPGAGLSLVNYLAPGDGGMRVYRRPKDGAKEARLVFRTLAEAAPPRRALLEIRLETGLKHQIRAQLAFAGLPVVGDFRYGAFGKPARPESVQAGRAVLLHAWRLTFRHPATGERMTLETPPPPYWAAVAPGFELPGRAARH